MVIGVAGQRARDPPDPVPKIRGMQKCPPLTGSSEVKPRSVSGVSVVFGHAKPGKLAALTTRFDCVEKILKVY